MRAWAKKHHYQPSHSDKFDTDLLFTADMNDAMAASSVLDVTCPFLDKTTCKCVCYDIRPEVCQIYDCHKYAQGKQPVPGKSRHMSIHNLRLELFNQEVPSYDEFQMILEYIKMRPKAGEVSES